MGSAPAIAGFKLGGLIGEGPSGMVYSAQRLADGEACVVKVFEREGVTTESILSFVQARRSAAACRGSGVADVVDFAAEGRWPFVAMKGPPGETLETLRKRERFDVSRACEIARAVCIRLAALHDGGLVHGSLKPSNILVRGWSAASLEVSLEDVGAHVFEAADAECTVVYVDNPAVDYQAPEDVMGGSGAPTPAADLYALGVILFEALAGVRPFSGSQLERVQSRINGAAPRLQTINTSVPSSLDKLVSCLLSRDPGGRPSSARGLAVTLGRFVGGDDLDEEGVTKAWISGGVGGASGAEVGHTVVVGGPQQAKHNETVVLPGETVPPIGESGQVTIVPKGIGGDFLDRAVAETASGNDSSATVIVDPALLRTPAPVPVGGRRPPRQEKTLPAWLKGPWSSQKKLLAVNIACLVVVLIGLVFLSSR